MNILPKYKGYTIDLRLKEIRKLNTMEFLSFDSDKGDKILTSYIRSLDSNSKAFDDVAKIIC